MSMIPWDMNYSQSAFMVSDVHVGMCQREVKGVAITNNYNDENNGMYEDSEIYAYMTRVTTCSIYTVPPLELKYVDDTPPCD
jgi:hypothetical protein